MAESIHSSQAVYIERNWSNCSREWAMYARNHSPMLLQTGTTTNNVESYHSQLKGKFVKFKTSKALNFKETIRNCIILDKDRFTSSSVAEHDFRTKKTSLCSVYPQLSKFPFPIQSLIFTQYQEARKLYADGETGDITFDEETREMCTCLFTKKYFLPCRHVFLIDLVKDESLITDEEWNKYTDGWDECGYEVFWQRGLVEVEEQQRPAVQSNVPLKTCIELLTNSFYMFQDASPELPNPMVDFVEKVSQALRNMTLEDHPTINLNYDQMNNSSTLSNLPLDNGISGGVHGSPSRLPQQYNNPSSSSEFVNAHEGNNHQPVVTATWVDETQTTIRQQRQSERRRQKRKIV
jgi:hypothetical protein